MDHIHYVILSISTFLFLSFSFSSAICNKEDKKALIAFKNFFPNNTFPDGWDSQDDCCLWAGVDCDGSTGHVTSLYFTTHTDDFDYYGINNLTGTIPPSVGDLTYLQSFYFSGYPELVGPIPSQLANLKNMQNFVLDGCGISGPIPSFISTWTHLEGLVIANCELTGSIPPSLGNLVNLTRVSFAYNKLTGTIPASLFGKFNYGILKNGLTPIFQVNNNKLTGPIPRSFASVKSLDIDVSYNELCGPIPTGGIFESLNPGFVAHNKCLCGAPLAACK